MVLLYLANTCWCNDAMFAFFQFIAAPFRSKSPTHVGSVSGCDFGGELKPFTTLYDVCVTCVTQSRKGMDMGGYERAQKIFVNRAPHSSHSKFDVSMCVARPAPVSSYCMTNLHWQPFQGDDASQQSQWSVWDRWSHPVLLIFGPSISVVPEIQPYVPYSNIFQLSMPQNPHLFRSSFSLDASSTSYCLA